MAVIQAKLAPAEDEEVISPTDSKEEKKRKQKAEKLRKRDHEAKLRAERDALAAEERAKREILKQVWGTRQRIVKNKLTEGMFEYMQSTDLVQQLDSYMEDQGMVYNGLGSAKNALLSAIREQDKEAIDWGAFDGVATTYEKIRLKELREKELREEKEREKEKIKG